MRFRAEKLNYFKSRLIDVYRITGKPNPESHCIPGSIEFNGPSTHSHSTWETLT